MAPLDAATRDHVVQVIKRALEEDDSVSQALLATAGFHHLMPLQTKRADRSPWVMVLMANVLAGLIFIALFMFFVFLWYMTWTFRKRMIHKRYALWRQGEERRRWYETFIFQEAHAAETDAHPPKYHMS